MIFVLICALLSNLFAQCTELPNLSWTSNASYSYQVYLNGTKTTYNGASGWMATANVNNTDSGTLKLNTPVTTNGVRINLSITNESCNTILVQWELVNTAAEERTVGACVYADVWILVDQDTWTLFEDHTGCNVNNAPFYIKATEPLSGITSGRYCNSNAFNLTRADAMSFNWNSKVLAAGETKVFQFRYQTRLSDNCTYDDIQIGHGPCINDSRDIVFYVSGCELGNLTLPPTLRGKECNFSCPAGKYVDLTINGSTCIDCAAGKEADGFSVIYNNLTSSPTVNFSPFNSECSGTNCRNWTVWGNYLTTGFQSENVNASLSLTVDIFQTAGQVLFEYTSPETRFRSAELLFYIDGHQMNNISYVSDIWKNISYSLSFGTHQLKWVFRTFSSYNPSEIGARLRNVEIRGTKYLVTSCRDCTSGSTSQVGQQCSPCPFNTVPGGTGQCVTCPVSQYANPGDAECKDRAACQDSDYYAEYGPCVNNVRSVTKKLYSPVICLEGTPPPQTNDTCPTCDPGHYKKSGICSPCEDGTYRDSNMTDDKCVTCPSGTYASKKDNHMRPSITTNSWFVTGCESDDRYINNCATNGWFEEETFVTPGNHFGPVTVWLNRTVDATEFGTLFFSYTTHLRNDSYLKFYSSNFNYYLMANSSGNDVKRNFTAYFERGSTNFSWIFIKTCHNGCSKEDNNVTDTVEIDELFVSTESLGGGTECTQCNGGYFAPEGSIKCQECLAGTYSQSASAECLPCPEGSYSNDNRATECKPCFNNTYPSDDRSTCVFNNCGFQHNETFAFSLAALQTDNGLIDAVRPNNESRLFYLDICTTANSNRTCRDYWDAVPDGGDIAYACTVSTDSQDYITYMLGRDAEMNFLEVKDANDTVLKYGVNLTYTNGDWQHCATSPRGPVTQSIEILFICVPDIGAGEPLPATPFQDSTENCRFHYEWITEYACRICSASDYDKLESECVKGKKNTSYVIKQSQTPCTHGYVPTPVWQISSCPNPLIKLNAGGVVGIVLGAIVILGVSIFFIVYYIRKNRALRYQLFQKSNFSLVDKTENAGGDADGDADGAASSTSMFGGSQQTQEEYKSVNFSGVAETADSAF